MSIPLGDLSKNVFDLWVTLTLKVLMSIIFRYSCQLNNDNSCIPLCLLEVTILENAYIYRWMRLGLTWNSLSFIFLAPGRKGGSYCTPPPAPRTPNGINCRKWMNEWMNEWVNEWMSYCTYRCENGSRARIQIKFRTKIHPRIIPKRISSESKDLSDTSVVVIRIHSLRHRNSSNFEAKNP